MRCPPTPSPTEVTGVGRATRYDATYGGGESSASESSVNRAIVGSSASLREKATADGVIGLDNSKLYIFGLNFSFFFFIERL